MTLSLRFVAMLAALSYCGSAAWAGARPPDPGRTTVDPGIMQIDEPSYLGAQLNGATSLVDSSGKAFTLGELFGKPLILLLSYYSCDGTCSTMNENLAKILGDVSRFKVGKDYQVLTVSFDRTDTPKSAEAFLEKVGLAQRALAPAWRHSVVQGAYDNKDEDLAAKFASTVGFQFQWSHADKTFLHPNVLVFLTPQGRVARYIYGTRMNARAIELALTDADWSRIANSTQVFDLLSGVCYSYNYSEGRYQINYSFVIGFGSLLMGLSLLGIGALVFRKRRKGEMHA